RVLALITGIFVAVVALGVGLAALQLLPTYELSGESIRGGGLAYRDAASFSLPPWEILRALLPGFLENPFSEYVGYVGFLPLSLAILAFAIRKDNPYTLFSLALAVIAIFLALGGYNPFYPFVFKLVPGLSLFRVPARWLFVYTFAAATMAGIGMSSLTRPSLLKNTANDFIHSLRKAQFWTVLSLLLVFGIIWVSHSLLRLPRGEVLAIWIPLLGLSIALILVGPWWAPDPKLALGVLSLTALELFFAQTDLDLNHPIPPQAYSSLRPSVLQLKLDEGVYRVLSISVGTFDPGDMADLKQILRDQLSPERITDFIVATKYKEILTPNLSLLYKIPSIDGYDGGVLPLKNYADFKRLIIESEDPPHGKAPGSHFDQADGLLREQLDAIPDTQLLGMLNVKYIIADKAHDPWVDNAYYDLGSMLRVNKNNSPRLTNLPSTPATAIGIISYLSGSQNLTNTTPVAMVTVSDGTGRSVTVPLAAGVDTAEGDYNRPFVKVNHKMARVSSLWKGNPQAYNYYTKVDLKGIMYPKEIRFSSVADGVELSVRGVSLIDERTYTSEPVSLNPRLKVVHSGDVKIYENLDWLPRAYLVRRFEVA
ncbi:MAG: YfhO family protein, partial [Chloroflexi bacterium]|nr:YfhO family protein [Chloroflexota bacterium]